MSKPMIAFFLALLATSATASAASHPQEHPHDTSSQSASQTAAPLSGTGVLKAVNVKAGKVQITHEPITALDWPAMTMWFVLKTPLPQDIKAGDSVRFEMTEGDKKQWAIVKITRE